MIKWGIIGCGVISSSHVSAISDVKGRAELYAVCDIVKSKAEKLASDYGAKRIYSDYREMLSDPQLDVVSICTPSGMHGEMSIAAAKSGKHILCEKPMEITSKKLDEVIKTVNECGVKMGCVFQRRVQPFAVKVKNALDAGLFGKVVLAEAHMKDYRSPEYYRSADWRATWELDGGGSLMNQSIHGIDLISWFMGGVSSVSAICATQVHDIPVEDTAVAVLRFNNGAIGVIEGTTSVFPRNGIQFELHCEKGSIVFTDGGITLWGSEVCSGLPSGTDMRGEEGNLQVLGALSHTPLVLDLIDAIENDRPPMVTPEEGRKAVDIILAIYESSKTGRAIALK